MHFKIEHEGAYVDGAAEEAVDHLHADKLDTHGSELCEKTHFGEKPVGAIKATAEMEFLAMWSAEKGIGAARSHHGGGIPCTAAAEHKQKMWGVHPACHDEVHRLAHLGCLQHKLRVDQNNTP